MDVRGYMVEVQYDGQTLTAHGTTRAARVALRGQQHDAGPVVLPRADIASVEWKPASVLTNGRLTVRAVDGSAYVLHFRRKQADGFTELARELGANV